MSLDHKDNAAFEEMKRWCLEWAKIEQCKSDIEPGKFVLISREDFWALVKLRARNLDNVCAVLEAIKFYEIDGAAAEEPTLQRTGSEQSYCGREVEAGRGWLCGRPYGHDEECSVIATYEDEGREAPHVHDFSEYNSYDFNDVASGRRQRRGHCAGCSSDVEQEECGPCLGRGYLVDPVTITRMRCSSCDGTGWTDRWVRQGHTI